MCGVLADASLVVKGIPRDGISDEASEALVENDCMCVCVVFGVCVCVHMSEPISYFPRRRYACSSDMSLQLVGRSSPQGPRQDCLGRTRTQPHTLTRHFSIIINKLADWSTRVM